MKTQACHWVESKSEGGVRKFLGLTWMLLTFTSTNSPFGNEKPET